MNDEFSIAVLYGILILIVSCVFFHTARLSHLISKGQAIWVSLNWALYLFIHGIIPVNNSRLDHRSYNGWQPFDAVMLSSPLWSWAFHLCTHSLKVSTILFMVILAHVISLLSSFHWSDVHIWNLKSGLGTPNGNVVIGLNVLDFMIAFTCYVHWYINVTFSVKTYTHIPTQDNQMELEEEIQPTVVLPMSTRLEIANRALRVIACGKIDQSEDRDILPDTSLPDDHTETSSSSPPLQVVTTTTTIQEEPHPRKEHTVICAIKLCHRSNSKHMAHTASVCMLFLIAIRSLELFMPLHTHEDDITFVFIHQLSHLLSSLIAMAHTTVHVNALQRP